MLNESVCLNYQLVEIPSRELQRAHLVYFVLKKQKTVQEDDKIFKQFWSNTSKYVQDLKEFVYEERTQKNPSR